jgi:hypothetical protein
LLGGNIAADAAVGCFSDETSCDGVCIDVTSDLANCGACDTTCDPGLVCSLGRCTDTCDVGLSRCEDSCYDLETSTKHCGDCNRACDAGSRCVGGNCVAPLDLGEECSEAECGPGATCMDGICCSALPSAMPNTWATRAPMPTPRYYPAGVRLGRFIYVLGGNHYGGAGVVARNERYDPDTNTWTTMAPMPAARIGVTAIGTRGKIHAFSNTDHWVYDPGTNTWATLAPIPVSIGSYSFGAAVLGNRIHLFGAGRNSTYDLVTEAWVDLAPPPGMINYPLVAAVGGRAYVIAGNRTNGEYNPATNTWQTRAMMPTARSVITGASSSVVGGKIYVTGGGSPNTEAYDPALDSWETMLPDAPMARDSAALTGLCGKVYFVGGSVPGASYPRNDVFTVF